MTDVEKYGVFALVFVGLVLGLTLVQGAFSAEDEPLADTDGARARPVIIRSAADVVEGRILRPGQASTAPRRAAPSTPRASEPATRYRVPSVAEGRGPFRWDESPLPYGGPRAEAETPDGTGLHTIRKGETLSDISKLYFGTTTRWRELVELNPGLDPNRMQVGDTLRVSAAAGAASGATAQRATPKRESRSYTVRPGDTLSAIAQREMGSATRTHELFQANRDKLKNEHELKVGMALRIP